MLLDKYKYSVTAQNKSNMNCILHKTLEHILWFKSEHYNVDGPAQNAKSVIEYFIIATIYIGNWRFGKQI